MANKKNINPSYAIILCGGAGTRLWPVSRKIRPKHLIAFKDNNSLLQNTVIRLKNKIPLKNIYLVANKEHEFLILDQMAVLYDKEKPNIILEPEARNTLPAIALGIKNIKKIDNEAIISIFPSDHEITNDKEFFRVWENSIKLANENYFTMIGIKPDFASTGYGYIKPSKEISNHNNLSYEVSQFKEKPSKDLAKKFIKKGYLWNAGMFVFKFEIFRDLMERYQSKLYDQINSIDENNINMYYKKIISISIDYGLAERANKVAVVTGSIGWSDLGNWNSIYRLLPKDKNENSIKGKVLQKNTKNCLLWNESGVLTTSGLENIIAINTDDATLICNREDTEEVKLIVNELKEKEIPEADTHLKVYRPWGSYTVLEKGKGFKIKRIQVKPKQKLSLQLHEHRSEHWVVVEGVAKIINGKTESIIKKNESTFIPKKTKHRLENPTEEILILIEVQSGEYLEEDDIQRFGDNYGREIN